MIEKSQKSEKVDHQLLGFVWLSDSIVMTFILELSSEKRLVLVCFVEGLE